MALVIWCIVFGAVIVLAIWATRMASSRPDEGLHDMGYAILEFGRAFPQEAIRQLQTTKDGKAVFVRLYDNKAGFMRNMARHFACHLIEPGTVRVTASASGKGLAIEFLDALQHNATFEFASPAEAAEVSLWLLGNYVAAEDLPAAPAIDPAANNNR